jgi:DNA-binding response OmpR family regulator
MPLHAAPPRPDAPRGHLVIAEDEPMIGRILEHKLVREGHRVSWVRDAQALRSVLSGGGVDVALVDATLDGVDGLEFMSSLAATAVPPPAHGWLAMVEQRDAAAPARALAAGAAGVVTKPFKPTVVAGLVLDVLQGLAV